MFSFVCVVFSLSSLFYVACISFREGHDLVLIPGHSAVTITKTKIQSKIKNVNECSGNLQNMYSILATGSLS